MFVYMQMYVHVSMQMCAHVCIGFSGAAHLIFLSHVSQTVFLVCLGLTH